MTGAEAAKQAANKIERAATQPIISREDESDGDDSILVPSTTPGALGLNADESQGGNHYQPKLKDPGTSPRAP